jgi:Na+/proline symporter
MSTFDSIINSMGSVTVNDFARRYLLRGASEEKLVFTAKALTVFFGGLMLVFALWQIQTQGETAMEKLDKLVNVIGAIMPSFFLMGVLSRRVNTGGAVIGAVAGLVFAVVFNGIPGIVLRWLDWINWMWITGLAMTVNVVVGYAASYLFPAPAVESAAKIYRS